MTKLVQLTGFDEPQAPWLLRRKEIIPLPPERVWSALTREEELTRWWCESADVDLRVGGRYRFSGSNVYGDQPAAAASESTPRSASFEITQLVPHERLQFRWPLLGVETTVTYQLDNLMELTELRLTHTASEAPGGWPFPSDRPNWWWIALPALRSYLENGQAALKIDYRSTEEVPAARFAVDFTTFPWIVWSKLTKAEELAKWWGKNVEIDLAPEGTFKLGLEGEGPSRILDIEEGRRLVHDWTWGDSDESRIEWTIEETDAATRVTFVDQGPWAAGVRRDARRIYWASTLLHLKQMSERGMTPREYQEP